MQTKEEILKEATWVAKDGKIQPVSPYERHDNSIGYCRLCEFEKIIKGNIYTCPSLPDGEYKGNTLEILPETDDFFRKVVRLKIPNNKELLVSQIGELICSGGNYDEAIDLLNEYLQPLETSNQTLLDEVNRLNAYIEQTEAKKRKTDAGFLILMKGGKFCPDCKGHQYRMNRNGYREDCFTCNGTGAVFN